MTRADANLLIDSVQPVNLLHRLSPRYCWMGLPGQVPQPRLPNVRRLGDKDGTHGTFVSAPTWSSGFNGFPALDCSGGYVNAGTGLLPTGAASVCGVARANVGSSGYRCLFSAFAGNPEAFEVFVHDEGVSNTLGWGAYVGQALYPGVVVVGDWFHWCLTSDGTNTKIYHNGVKGPTDGTTNWTTFATDVYYIGSRGGSFVWPGQVGGVWLYDRTLSGFEVAQHYAQWRRRFPELLSRPRAAVRAAAPAGGTGVTAVKLAGSPARLAGPGGGLAG